MNGLTEKQIDGQACIACGRESDAMIPVYVETSQSVCVFYCADRQECCLSVREIEEKIIAFDDMFDFHVFRR